MTDYNKNKLNTISIIIKKVVIQKRNDQHLKKLNKKIIL